MKRINGARIYATLLALTLSLTATAGATGATPAKRLRRIRQQQQWYLTPIRPLKK